jgi:rod shape-determining protein MreB
MMSGLPRTVTLTSTEVREAIDEPVSAMVDSVVSCLGAAPPELAQDLIYRGIHLVGGGGMLRGMAERVAAEAKVDVRLVRQPLESVVLGAGQCIQSFDEVREMFMTGRNRR